MLITAASEDKFSPNPVTRGALLRHKVTVRSAGSQFSWGSAISEEFSPSNHPDAVIKGPGGPEANLDLVFDCPVNSEDVPAVVLDRWESVLEKVQLEAV